MTETKTGRGRPRKSTNIIEVNNIKLEFIVTKTDDYENSISYIKIIDKSFKTKLQPILSQNCDDCKLPLWLGDDGMYMLKCKNRWMPESKVFEKNELFTANLIFAYYCMSKNDDLLQGYYVKIELLDN